MVLPAGFAPTGHICYMTRDIMEYNRYPPFSREIAPAGIAGRLVSDWTTAGKG
jgi:hypothetical protein